MSQKNECVTGVLIGAGNRGKDVYGQYALDNPSDLKFIAVAEPSAIRRDLFSKAHRIPESYQFTTWEDLLKEKIAEVAFICTQDQMHTRPAMKALSLGYDVLLEKPMATNPEECVLLTKKAEEVGKQLQIAYVLRYSQFFQTIHDTIKSGKLGKLITIDHRENVSYWHMAHSFVRGNWAKESTSSPMLLAKSCHDLDILCWLVGNPKVVSSFGSLTHFKPENAPQGAAKRCLNGCTAASSCKYFAPRIYIDIIPLMRIGQLGGSRLVRFIANLALSHSRIFSKIKNLPLFRHVNEFNGWPVSTITEDLTLDGKWEALRTGPYGKCVYFANNDVVDHQVVIIEFENVTATFTMHGHSHAEGRTIRIDGTKGTLIGRALFSETVLKLYDHISETKNILIDKKMHQDTGKNRGAETFMSTDLIKSFLSSRGKNSAKSSLESHLLAFAAEEARLNRKVVHIDEFNKRYLD
ncbi:MAG: Gfo/Idh/MocA family protein [Candidatus Hodarchaeales archaeon]